MKFSDFSEFELESSFIECIDCGVCLEFNELNDEPHFLNDLAVGKTIKEYQCDECNSKKYEVSHPDYSDFPEIIIFDHGKMVSGEFPIVAEYGRLAGLHILLTEKITIDRNIKRVIESLQANRALKEEVYDLEGKFIGSKHHPLLEKYVSNNVFKLPLSESYSNKEYKVFNGWDLFDIDDEDKSPEGIEKWIINRESEWVNEIPYDHLVIRDGDHQTLSPYDSVVRCGYPDTPRYDWGNLGPRYSGFVNQIVDSETKEFQRFYVVKGKKVATERPIWTFNADKSLKSLTCNCYGEEFVMF